MHESVRSSARGKPSEARKSVKVPEVKLSKECSCGGTVDGSGLSWALFGSVYEVSAYE